MEPAFFGKCLDNIENEYKDKHQNKEAKVYIKNACEARLKQIICKTNTVLIS